MDPLPSALSNTALGVLGFSGLGLRVFGLRVLGFGKP